jgi:S1-C subfamily serine protease
MSLLPKEIYKIRKEHPVMGKLGGTIVALVILVAIVGFAFAYPHLSLNSGNLLQVPGGIQTPFAPTQTMPAGVDRSNPVSSEEFRIGQLGASDSGSQGFSLPALFNQSDASVVQITDTDQSNPSQSRLGSGFVYDDNGHVVTNYHVVSGANQGTNAKLDVTFSDGTTYRANVIGADPYADLAVLYIEQVPKDKLHPMPLADSSKLQVGERVAAIGNPFGLSGSMTAGIVSGLGRLIPAQEAPSPSQSSSSYFSIPDVIQTDAAINPGNSGGPLLDMKGEVLGVNSAIQSTTGEFSGIGFAIPSNTIKKIVPDLITAGVHQHPYLGVSGTNITPAIASAIGLKEPRGFLVVSVVPGSPADKAGIHGGTKPTDVDGRRINLGGDVIVGLDNQKVRKIEDILSYLEENKNVGDTIRMTVVRDGSMQELSMVLGARPG